jgi:hypothetical protein
MGGTTRIARQIVAEVASREEVSVTELPPLSAFVDVDALESLFANPPAAAPADRSVTFQYEEYSVTVSGGGDVTVD